MSKTIEIYKNKKPCFNVEIRSDFSGLCQMIKDISYDKDEVVVVTDEMVATNFFDGLKEALKNSSLKVKLYEDAKSANVCEDELVIVLGGRSVIKAFNVLGLCNKKIVIPTTLSAMADIRGCNCNESDGIYINVDALKTLKGTRYFSGFAFIMQSAIVRDEKFYIWLIENMYDICERNNEVLEEMLGMCLKIQKFLLEKDPEGINEAHMLDFGKNIGIALYEYYNHERLMGECLTLGIACSAFISYKKTFLAMEEYYEVRDMFVPFYLPISVDDLDCEKVYEILVSLGMDKEFVLLKKVGKTLNDSEVSKELVMEALDEINFTEEDARE